MAQPTALLPAPRTDEEIGDDLFVALSGARRIDDVGQGKDGFIRTLARKLIRNPRSARRRNPMRGRLVTVATQTRRDGGDMNQPPNTTVVTRGVDIPPQQPAPISVILTQHFAPADVAQNQLAVAQQGESYTPQQLTAGTLIVQNEFDGVVPGWKTLREKLLEREIPTTATQARALEEVLVDSMPVAKKVQAPPPPLAVVEAVEEDEEGEGESALRFLWGENGPTILSMVLAIALVLAGFFAVYLVFKAKNTMALPPERPPASVVLPTPGTQTESGTTYVCVFIYDGWQGGADVMLAEAVTAFYQLPPEKVGDLWTIIKGRPAGANYPEITTVNDAWNSANAGDGVIVSLSQAELTTLGGTCSGTWEAKK